MMSYSLFALVKKATVLFLAIIPVCLSAQLDQTAYFAASRLDYYSSEKSGQVMVFVPDEKKGMNVTIDLVFEFKFLNRNVPVFPGHAVPVAFSLEGFHQGDNEVTVSFYEEGKWIDSRKVNIVVRTPKFNEVKIDRLSGGLIADGLPFFPVGFYCNWPVNPTFAEEEVVKGFNLMSPYWKIDHKGRKERIRFMDRCAELGMKVNYNVCSVAGGGGVTSSHGEELTGEEKLDLLRKEIELLRDHPALLAWYISDEPEGQGVPPDSLEAAYKLIKELDPFHPVSIVYMAPHMAKHYRHVMDIAMTDPYPVPNGPVTEVADYVETLDNYFRYEKPVWLVPQAFGGNEWWTREPDPRELRAMTYLGIVHHASGVQYFIRRALNGSPKSQALWGECGAIAMEIKELLPSLTSGQPGPPVIPSVQDIHTRVINLNGMFTILAVNTLNKPVAFTLKMEEVRLSMAVDVLFENRKINMTDGIFEDMIDAYGVRLYRIDTRMKPDWMKDMKPGNLTVDPSFEDISAPGIPAACYVKAGEDRGATVYLDGLVHRKGDHSIRLNTPEAEEGVVLSFFGLELKKEQSYSISVWARKAAGSPSKKPVETAFTLSLGADNEKRFNLTEEWTEYSFSTAGTEVRPSLARWVMPGLELNGKGTAWFDLIQVVPDMEMNSNSREVAKRGGLEIELKSKDVESKIFYTLDGSEPTMGSESYLAPFILEKSAVVNASAYRNDRLDGTIRGQYFIHKATGAPVRYLTTYEQYIAGGETGLTDGIRASQYYKDGRWQGFHGQDAGMIVDLGANTEITDVRINFLQDISVWIFLPVEVMISLSADGVTYRPEAMVTHDIPPDRRGALIHEFKAGFSNTKARFIKIEAKSMKVCPEWHSGAHQPCWLFTDEITVE